MALCLLVVLAYANGLTGGFVLDSKVLILEDPRIRQATATNLDLIVQRSYWWPFTDSNLYRPVTTLSYLLNHTTLGGDHSPIPYHALNLLLHAANVLLAYALLLRLSARFWASLCVAAVWAVHPLSTEAVTNLAGRADLLAAFGVLGALLAYERIYPDPAARDSHSESGLARRNKPPRRTDATAASAPTSRMHTGRWFSIAIAVAMLGMFSKESAAAVVGVIVCHDIILRVPQTRLRNAAWRWLGLLLPLAALLWQRARVVPATLPPDPFVDNPLLGADFLGARLTALSVAGRYLWLMIWPRTLSSDYSYAQIPVASGRLADWAPALPAAVVLTVTAALLLRAVSHAFVIGSRPEKSRSIGTDLACCALAFAALTFLPASNLIFLTGTIMAERLMYLPSLGLIACAAILLTGALQRVRPPALVVTLAVGMVIAGCTVRTFVRNRDWRNETSLWASAARAAPNAFKGHQGLADALYEATFDRDLPTVLAAAERSVAILDPLPDARNVPTAFRRTAGYYFEQGDRLRTAGAVDQSTAAYERSVVLTSRYLAIVRAIGPERWPRSIGDNPDEEWKSELSEAYVMLATGNSRLSKSASTIEAAGQAQVLQPLSPVPYRLLATALIEGGKYDEASIWLLTGFTVTGDSELRQATIDLFRVGGDPQGCALRDGVDGPSLNPACETVRHHLCLATQQASRILREIGRTAPAEQLENGPLKAYRCG